MKHKSSELITIFLFCGFLALMAGLYLLSPKADFSENEKRYLSDFPEPQWDTVASGEWGEDMETYLADHIPGRDFLVGLNAYFDLYTGRQAGKDILLCGDRLVEAPVTWNPDAAIRNITILQNLAANTGRELDLMIVPSAGWATGMDGYSDEEQIREIYAMAQSGIRPIETTGLFRNRPDLYFRTDHHWNSAGAYGACSAYMTQVGREYPEPDFFTVEAAGMFQGSTYSRSALWLTEGEELELWHGSTGLTVSNGETEGTHEGVFYREQLDEADKYTVYLDGNHSIVRIYNPNATGKLLVIRDSYANLLGCFLPEAYAEVVLIDMRYYKQPVSQLISQEDFDNILVCYSLSNFLTDTNLIWLK